MIRRLARQHAQRLIHYIETLEAQAELIRPRTVETAMALALS